MSEAERKSEHTPVSYTSEELIGAARFCFADPKYYNCFGCPLEHKPCDNLERLLANRLELCEAALRAQEQNDPLTLTGTRKIGEIVTGRIVALDAEKGLASIHWEPYAHEPKGADQ